MAEEEEIIAEQQAPPEKLPRFTLTLAEKIGMCIDAERLVKAEKRMSWKGHCRLKEIDPSQLRHWTKTLVKMKTTMELTRRKKSEVACNEGGPSRLDKVKHHLLPWAEAPIADSKKVSTSKLFHVAQNMLVFVFSKSFVVASAATCSLAEPKDTLRCQLDGMQYGRPMMTRSLHSTFCWHTRLQSHTSHPSRQTQHKERRQTQTADTFITCLHTTTQQVFVW